MVEKSGELKHPIPLMSYSLAIMPPTAIAEQVKTLKLALREAIGKNYGSLNAEAHISLDSFEASETNYPFVLAEYQRILSGLTPFDIALSGFGHFDSYYPAFYIQLVEQSQENIRSHCDVIRKEFSKPIKKQYVRKWADESRSPHLTVGRRLTTEWIEIAYGLFKEFEQRFSCDSFVIRKYEEKRRQYDVIDTIPLLGQSNLTGGQLALNLGI